MAKGESGASSKNISGTIGAFRASKERRVSTEEVRFGLNAADLRADQGRDL